MTTTIFISSLLFLRPFDFELFLGEDLLLQSIIHVSDIFFDNKNKTNLNIHKEPLKQLMHIVLPEIHTMKESTSYEKKSFVEMQRS